MEDENDDFRRNDVFGGIQRVWVKTITKSRRDTLRMEFRNRVETCRLDFLCLIMKVSLSKHGEEVIAKESRNCI